MRRRPPRSSPTVTLVPYSTLFRSLAAVARDFRGAFFLLVQFLQDGHRDEDVVFLEAEQRGREIGRAHVCTPVTNAQLVCRILLEKKKTLISTTESNTNTRYNQVTHNPYSMTQKN